MLHGLRLHVAEELIWIRVLLSRRAGPIAGGIEHGDLDAAGAQAGGDDLVERGLAAPGLTDRQVVEHRTIRGRERFCTTSLHRLVRLRSGRMYQLQTIRTSHPMPHSQDTTWARG